MKRVQNIHKAMKREMQRIEMSIVRESGFVSRFSKLQPTDMCQFL